MRLSIGTAQFGRDYGIANCGGKIAQDEISDIFKVAIKNDIKAFDTAEDYGDSEKIIGDMIKTFDIDAKIITKVFVDLENDAFDLRLKKSLESLNTKSVYGLLVHGPDALIGDQSKKVFSIINSAKERGLAEKIGVSVATPEQALIILDKYDLDIIQVPCNLFDQRFISSNMIGDFVKAGLEVHVRSVFLQGLFFVDNLNSYFDDIRPDLLAICSFANKNSISISRMALGFVKSILGVDKIIVGIDNSDQLLNLVNDYNAILDEHDFSKFSIPDDRFINPAKWPVGGWHK